MFSSPHLRLCKHPAPSRSLTSVGRMARLMDWWVDRLDGQRDE